MTQPRQTPETDPLDPSDPEIADLLLELSGEPPAGDTRAAFSIDDIAEVAEPGDDPLTGRERELGYLEAGVDPTGGVTPSDTVSVESLVEGELTEDETFDPIIAAEEGVPWIPPVDPVVVPDESDPEGVAIAAGIGTSAVDEPYDADHHSSFLPADDEMTARVREALRADAMTTAYADNLAIDTEADVVTLRGSVEDIEDLDAVLAVAAVVEGVTEVVDEMEIAGL
jgi:hypothetical protein